MEKNIEHFVLGPHVDLKFKLLGIDINGLYNKAKVF